jgi:hypothetical protein
MTKISGILWTYFRQQTRPKYIDVLETGATAEAQLSSVHDLRGKIRKFNCLLFQQN